ncbi:MAG: helicase-exonuclease AddAB subunit AddB [Lachnospiraceae bacterium]|nr:helicase-exonuclease AddAB subunit AddB [Lachnospiraceae bacterium]
MALQFWIGSSGAGKSEQLYADVIRQSMEEPKRRFFILVPDQFTMQTQKELVTRHPNGGIMNIEVLSFGRLTHRIFEETGWGGQPVLDDTGKSLILRRIAANCADALPVIGSNMKRIGYIHEVKSAVSEFMQYGIGPGELRGLTQYARPRGSLYYKLQDLQVLYEAFLKEIDGRFVTTEGQLGLLAQALAHSEMIRGSVVVFDGFTGFTPIQNQVIRQLLLLAKEVRVAVIMDGREDAYAPDGEQKLFAFSKKMMRSLMRLAQEAGVPRKEDVVLAPDTPPRFLHNPAMAHLERELFRYRNAPFTEEQDAIRLICASAPGEEVRQCARTVRRLVREEGYQYRDIAVITGDLCVYADYVEETFARFEIPCYIDTTKGIALNPFIEYIRSALKIILSNFSYEAVFHFLRSGLAGISMEETDRLENYVLRQGIRGRKRWSALFVRRTGTQQEADELAAVNETRQKFLDCLAPLLTDGTNGKDYVNHLYAFLTASHTYEQLSALEGAFQEAGDLVKAKEYGQIYRLVMELLEQIYDLIGEEEMPLQEFADILDAGFGEIQVGTIPQNVDRIVVGDMERTRLQEIKVLFFLGVNDGNIPRSGAKGGIISDIDREFLAQGQWEMAPSPRQQMYIQRLYLYMNMTKPSERLYLSYAKVSGEGKAMRPSYLIGTVRKLFPLLSVETPQTAQPQEQIEIREDGFLVLAEQLREYAKGAPVSEPFFFTLYRTYAEDAAFAGELQALVRTAFFRYEGSALGEKIAHALYGAILRSSVSRLEQYAACAYSYFLQYGLSLKEREIFSFEAVDMGTLFHGILEQFSALLEENGSDWFSFSEELGDRLLAEAVDAQAAVYGDNILFSSARYRYIITRIKRILRRTVFTLQSQLQKGKFRPERFEVSFSSLSDIEAVNISLSKQERMHLQGRIDRIDTCREDDTVYVKVIDYKSGSRSLDIAAIYYGLQLQLVVYMNAAVEMIGRKEPGSRIVPAAMLYYHISDPMVRAENDALSEEALNEKIRESLRMSGIVNEKEDVITRLDSVFGSRSEVIPVERKKDGSLGSRSGTLSEEELQTVSHYVNQKIKQLGKGILEGNITCSPYSYGGRNGCEYCVYRSICGFNERIPGYEWNRLESMTKDEAIVKMKE